MSFTDYRLLYQRWLYDITYHVFEVRIDATYHGRGGAVTVGVSAACEAERAYGDRDGVSHVMDSAVLSLIHISEPTRPY